MTRGWMALWALALAGVIFLSLWPFTIDPSRADATAWSALWRSWGWRTSRGDIAGNVSLFVPVGVLTALAAAMGRRVAAMMALGAIGLGVAVGVQAAQLYIPARDATMVDVVWNAVGLALGTVAGAAVAAGVPERGHNRADVRILPLLIIGAWLAYRLAPFVPAIDWQLIKDNLKPALLHPRLRWTDVVSDAAAWLAVAFLLTTATPRGRLDLALPLLVVAVFGAEVLIVYRDGVSAANLAGAVLAVVLWLGLVRWLPGAAWLIALILIGRVVLDGLWPFAFREAPVAAFQWLPFRGILGGSMWLNLLALLEKAFVYAALAYAGGLAVRSWPVVAIAGAAMLAGVEWLQRYQPGHVPEITDPLLLILAATACAIRGRPTHTGRSETGSHHER